MDSTCGQSMLPKTLPIGTVLQSRYRIEGIAGGGGMAVVYRGQELIGNVGKVWAIKELRPQGGTPEEQYQARQQFQREAQILAQLDHPDLPKVVDYFEEASRAYLVMDFVEGQSLQRLLDAAGGALEEQTVLAWAIQVCGVLAYLHRQQPPIIFRDLKPSNIMASPDGTIKLIDFGVARTYKAGQKRDTVAMGSENYAAPEQWGRQQTDGRSDIYALGATMYHLLTGVAPPQAFLPDAVVAPAILNPAVSATTGQIVLKAMDKVREGRYQTTEDLAAALRSLLPSVGRNCSGCGYPNRVQARFCGRCGVALVGKLEPSLQVVNAKGIPWAVAIQRTPFLIGRLDEGDPQYRPDLDLMAYDQQYISRRHAQIAFSGPDYVLMDLGSANGTYINDKLLVAKKPHVLHNGDRVSIGAVRLIFRLLLARQ